MASSAPSPIVRVAAVQAESGWLDLQASVKKTCSLIADAAAGGAALVAFPECFVPGYPAWIWSRPMDPEMTTRYIANSLRVDSPEMEQIRAAAAAHNVSVVLGFSENDNNSLYISQATISGTSGELLMVRRKMKPTHVERTVFGDSSGDSLLNVADVPAVGRVGALACWEHTQPLLKYHTHSQREEIHVSAWPALVPHVAGQGHWGMGIEGCTALSQVYAVESGTFVVQATGLVLQPGIDLMNTSQNPVYNTPGGGGAAIFGPDGCRLTEPLPPTQEGLVFADLDKRHILGVRMLIDTCGHYSRPDLLWLGVDSRARKPVQYAHSKKAVENEDKDKKI